MTTDRRHRKSWDAAGQSHFLTFSCFRRQPFLARPRSCEWFLDNLLEAKRKVSFDLWGYVVMPDHVHLLLLPTRGSRMAQMLYAVKQPVTLRAVRWVRKNAPSFLGRMEDRQPNGKVTRRFWQRGGGYDRNLRSVHDVHEKLTYLHENPVRRGLVDRAEDYLYSSARAWLLGDDVPIAIDRESFPALEGV